MKIIARNISFFSLLSLFVAASAFAHGSPCKKALKKCVPESNAESECHNSKVKAHYKEIVGCLEKNKTCDPNNYSDSNYQKCKDEVLSAHENDHLHDGDEHRRHSRQSSGSGAAVAQ